jgi:hypothetical protein
MADGRELLAVPSGTLTEFIAVCSCHLHHIPATAVDQPAASGDRDAS